MNGGAEPESKGAQCRQWGQGFGRGILLCAGGQRPEWGPHLGSGALARVGGAL